MEASKIEFKYYRGQEADQFSFIKIPKCLISDSLFSELTLTSKLLYGLLLDRMSLSMKNGWVDEENRVFIIYQVASIGEDLGVSRKCAIDTLKELEDFGLVEKKRRGLGLPNLLYIKSFMVLYTQLFNLLCEKADHEYGGRLPYHVHCIMDEFANLGRIPDWEILISTIRSREISASIILQSMAQLKSIYDKQADIISDNCDTLLFLGGKGRETLKEISELLGKETIDLYNTSDTRGNNPSYGTNYQKIGRELFTPDELARLPGDKCILQVKGVKPFYSNKYDIEKHPRYQYLADFNQKNRFIVADELCMKAKLKIADECEVLDLRGQSLITE